MTEAEPGALAGDAQVYELTLVSGDTVVVTVAADSTKSVAVRPAYPERRAFNIFELNGSTYVIPSDADRQRFDLELFNIDYLIDEEYHKLSYLPLLVVYAEESSTAEIAAVETELADIAQSVQTFARLAVTAAQIPLDNVAQSYTQLTRDQAVEKVWLNRKVHVDLADSVPLIGAPELWEGGYSGGGIEIAILDSGIDDSHPALRDFDLDPYTNDPKVIQRVNFSDDPNPEDWYGHGTHVAGIAAGNSVPSYYDEVDPTQLTTHPATDWDSAWSPDGSQIAFTSDRDGTPDIWLMNPDGSGQTKLLDLPTTYDACPAWSADSAQIVFARHDGAAEDNGLWIVNADGSGLTRVCDHGGIPTWSPDGTEIAFGDGGDIWAINVSTLEVRQITTDPAEDWHPAWSPDGSEIAFTSDRDGQWAIFAIGADGSGPRRVFLSSEAGEPAWSPDGSRIALESPVGTIIVVNADGPIVGPVAHPGQNTDPTWSPDGSTIAFTSWRSGNADIWTVGSNPTYTRYMGVAPGASLWNVKVLNHRGEGYFDWIISGIEYAAYGPDAMPGTGDEADIINLSLSSGWYSDGNDPLSLAVDDAVAQGLVVVVSAWNDGGYFNMAAPAPSRGAITVGATDKADALADFCSRGPTADFRVKPDVLAPGVDIIAPRARDTGMGDPMDDWYTSASGTSMAAPHVVGTAALMLQEAAASPESIPAGWTAPQYVKNALISTAVDLDYDVYSQGGGRIDIPAAVGSPVLVDPATYSFGVYSTAATDSTTLTFYNRSAGSIDLDLSVSLVDVFTGTEYAPTNAYTDVASLIVPAGGTADATLYIDLSGLPKSLYSGKVFATPSGDVEPLLHAIFGFAYLNELLVHKVGMDGNPAADHDVWVFSDREGPWEWNWQQAHTDENGDCNFFLADGSYHLVSCSQQGDSAVYTVEENVSVGTILVAQSVVLDERDTFPIDFDPNKPDQIMAEKAAYLTFSGDWVGGRWGWQMSYPGDNVSYYSAVSAFDVAASYAYYPQSDYYPEEPRYINTGEWHKLLYSLDEVTGPETFVADYATLVQRDTVYRTPLEHTLADWCQWVWWQHEEPFPTMQWQMNAPQHRVEWLSPAPAQYGAWYADQRDREWVFQGGDPPYDPGTNPGMSYGTHPLRSGINLEARDDTLWLQGSISADAAGHQFGSYVRDPAGHLQVFRDGEEVRDHEIDDWFKEDIGYGGTPHFEVIVDGWNKLELSDNTHTKFNFVLDTTRDWRPPEVAFSFPNTHPECSGPHGETDVWLWVRDDSPITDLWLELSTDGEWQRVELIPEGEPFPGWQCWRGHLGWLQDAYVSLQAWVQDNQGNSTFQHTSRGFYVSSPLIIEQPEGGFTVIRPLNVGFRIENWWEDELVFHQGDSTNRIDLQVFYDGEPGEVLWSTVEQGLAIPPHERWSHWFTWEPSQEGYATLKLMHRVIDGGEGMGSLGEVERGGVVVLHPAWREVVNDTMEGVGPDIVGVDGAFTPHSVCFRVRTDSPIGPGEFTGITALDIDQDRSTGLPVAGIDVFVMLINTWSINMALVFDAQELMKGQYMQPFTFTQVAMGDNGYWFALP
ncbi:S8 family serine peptidase, partial [Chloroflexota bacterium]